MSSIPPQVGAVSTSFRILPVSSGAAIEEAILLGCDVKQLNSLNQTRLNSYVIKGDFEKCKALSGSIR